MTLNQDEHLIVHTLLRYVPELLREKLRKLTVKPAYKSLMLGMLNDAYGDSERTNNVHTFVLFSPKIRKKDQELTPIAWATVCSAVWQQDKTNKRCNEISIFVHPDYRGEGLGTVLLKHAKECLKHTKRLWIAFPRTGSGRALFMKMKITDATGWRPVSVIDKDTLIDLDDL